MREKINNRDELLSHGDAESRRIVLDITEKTLRRLDAYERIKSIAHMEGDILHIGTRQWDLRQKRHVYLLGAGKACNHMAMAVDEILGDRRGDGRLPAHGRVCGRASPAERGGAPGLQGDPEAGGCRRAGGFIHRGHQRRKLRPDELPD